MWHDLMRRMQSQQMDESTPQETALMTARAREQEVQEIVGPPPEPPVAPKGESHSCATPLPTSTHLLFHYTHHATRHGWSTCQADITGVSRIWTHLIAQPW